MKTIKNKDGSATTKEETAAIIKEAKESNWYVRSLSGRKYYNAHLAAFDNSHVMSSQAKLWEYCKVLAMESYLASKASVPQPYKDAAAIAINAAEGIRPKVKPVKKRAVTEAAMKRAGLFVGIHYLNRLPSVRMARQAQESCKPLSTIKKGIVNKAMSMWDVSDSRRQALGLPRPIRKESDTGCITVEIEFTADQNTPLARTGEDGFAYKTLSNEDVEFAYDGSVCARHNLGQANPRFQEVRVSFTLKKPEALFKLCDGLNRAGAAINTTCGLHVHLDSRHLTHSQERNKRKRLISALNWLFLLVPPSRKNNSYCRDNTLRGRLPSDFSRRQAINPCSFARHGSTEIRLGSGSTDPNKILMWATLLSFIVNKRNHLRSLAEFLASEAKDNLKLWVTSRYRKFNPQESEEQTGKGGGE